MREIFERNLRPITKMTNLRREASRVRGEKGTLISALPCSKARIAETELGIIQIDRDLASEGSLKSFARSTRTSANSSSARSQPKTSSGVSTLRSSSQHCAPVHSAYVAGYHKC